MSHLSNRLLFAAVCICSCYGFLRYGFLESVTFYIYGPLSSNDHMNETQGTKPDQNRNMTREGTVVPVKDGKAFLVSAFLDERLGNETVRVIGIASRNGVPPLYCHMRNGSALFAGPAQVLIHPDHFGFPFGTADFLCQVPQGVGPVLEVSITTQELPDPINPFLQIQNTARQDTKSFQRQFTVCISTLFGNYSNVLQFVQALELYRMLGAGKVVVYQTDCSPLLQKVLDHYEAQGLVEVVVWDVGRYLRVSESWTPLVAPGDLHYHGQTAALNDCVYRNMAASEYVVLTDIDEVILPRLGTTWGDMVAFLTRRHPGKVSFSFENAVYRRDVFEDGGRVVEWPDVPGVDLLRHVHREPLRPGAFNARKLVLNPRSVVWTSVHSTLWHLGDPLVVPGSVARVHHCRSPDDKTVQRSELVRDTTIWKYSENLIHCVNRTLNQILQN